MTLSSRYASLARLLLAIPPRVAKVLRLTPTTTAWLTWTVAFGVVMIMLYVFGVWKTIPNQVYAASALHWLAHEPLYDLSSIHGFQYLPQSAMLYVPFVKLGTAGEVLWRLLMWAGYACGVWRACRLLFPSDSGVFFLCATSLCIGSAVDSLGTGQLNLAVAAMTLHVGTDLALRHWGRAALVLAVGVAVKPLMVVLLLLSMVVYRPMRWRLPPLVALVLLVPWLLADHTYVVAQYMDCVTKLGLSSAPEEQFLDLRAFLNSFGLTIAHGPYYLVRGIAGLGALALSFASSRRCKEPCRSLAVAAVSTAYLMLFNPRTQSNSYGIAAPFAAMFGIALMAEGRIVSAATLLYIVVAWSPNSRFMGAMEFRLKPLACLLFVTVLCKYVLSPLPIWKRVGEQETPMDHSEMAS